MDQRPRVKFQLPEDNADQSSGDDKSFTTAPDKSGDTSTAVDSKPFVVGTKVHLHFNPQRETQLSGSREEIKEDKGEIVRVKRRENGVWFNVESVRRANGHEYAFTYYNVRIDEMKHAE